LRDLLHEQARSPAAAIRALVENIRKARSHDFLRRRRRAVSQSLHREPTHRSDGGWTLRDPLENFPHDWTHAEEIRFNLTTAAEGEILFRSRAKTDCMPFRWDDVGLGLILPDPLLPEQGPYDWNSRSIEAEDVCAALEPAFGTRVGTPEGIAVRAQLTWEIDREIRDLLSSGRFGRGFLVLTALLVQAPGWRPVAWSHPALVQLLVDSLLTCREIHSAEFTTISSLLAQPLEALEHYLRCPLPPPLLALSSTLILEKGTDRSLLESYRTIADDRERLAVLAALPFPVSEETLARSTETHRPTDLARLNLFLLRGEQDSHLRWIDQTARYSVLEPDDQAWLNPTWREAEAEQPFPLTEDTPAPLAEAMARLPRGLAEVPPEDRDQMGDSLLSGNWDQWTERLASAEISVPAIVTLSMIAPPALAARIAASPALPEELEASYARLFPEILAINPRIVLMTQLGGHEDPANGDEGRAFSAYASQPPAERERWMRQRKGNRELALRWIEDNLQVGQCLPIELVPDEALRMLCASHLINPSDTAQWRNLAGDPSWWVRAMIALNPFLEPTRRAALSSDQNASVRAAADWATATLTVSNRPPTDQSGRSRPHRVS